ncbi:MAG: dTDP-3-amino-3,6-dideoxy-alpha-D-galactopyranose 3-N-acetyltransferase [candidate division BRC1 bacterium ADurb.BinA364]|nr:MAG: dTDP-3-amino-3,6-dideoxy-alpha-D-galactopyranose 3-N-acetyltransferase [candidate division BRC1 bacterium ADurb.BinA364]
MIASDVKLGRNVKIYHPDQVNLYGCEIGDGCKIGSFVEIRKQVRIGANVKIQAFAFIPEGVTIEDHVFIGPHACFTNDLYPRSVNPDGSLMDEDDWELVPTLVRKGASIGANATILCGVTIGEYALVGAGAVVTRDVPPYAIAVGSPARMAGDVRNRRSK